jgi:hypothetical protein
MAVHKTKRSNPLAQHQRKSARRRPDPQPRHSQPKHSQIQIKDSPANNTQLKAQLLDTLRHMNRGFGVVLAAFDKLQRQDRLHRPGIFPYDCLHSYRNRAEALRSLANRDLLRLFAGREELDALRFEQLGTQQEHHQ